MPDAAPAGTPSSATATPWLPPAVDAVCVPCPRPEPAVWMPSRGERNSFQCRRAPSAIRAALNERAPTSLLLQAATVNPSPVSQVPCHVAGGAP
ncbi:hypothetical protein OU994_21120 [Pseudoduganella sp. SL102]|nr:hypothetical protein [Pseudoduganella sp. SL102]WBS00795.1 hypothetical protein OU994_21120 [Pseudoduganella sp. SL102]